MWNGWDLSRFQLLISFHSKRQDCGIIRGRAGGGWVFKAFPKGAGQKRSIPGWQAQSFGSNLINAHAENLHGNPAYGKLVFCQP